MQLGVIRFLLVADGGRRDGRKRILEYVPFMERSGNGGILGL
jgi:hypothetical protein